MVKIGEAKPRTRTQIMGDIARRRAWTWKAYLPSSLTVTNCVVAYPQGNSAFRQKYLWPFYMVTAGSSDGRAATLFVPLDW